MQISKISSKQQKRLPKDLVKDNKVFLKKKKKKNDNMVANDTKIYLKMKNKTKPLLFIEKYGKKSLIIIIRNYHFLKKCFFKKVILLKNIRMFRKNQFWSYKFTLVKLFKIKLVLKSWFKWEKSRNLWIKDNYEKN